MISKEEKMFLTLVLVLVVVAMVTAVVYSSYSTRMKLEESSDMDFRMVREAAEHSTKASNSTNEIVALVESVKAHRTIEILIRRYGVERVSKVIGRDMKEMLDILEKQMDKIMYDLMSKYPQLLPNGDLLEYVGYVENREKSRQDDMIHLEDDAEY